MDRGLTVLVGAGASAPFGVPSTNALTGLVKQALLGYVPCFEDTDQFKVGVEAILSAAARFGDSTFTFEHMLEVIEAAATLQVAWDPKHWRATAESALTQPKASSAQFFSGPMWPYEMVVNGAIHEAVGQASDAAADWPDWPQLVRLWSALADRFTLSIATLNYDTLVEHALGLGASNQGLVEVPGEDIWRLDPVKLGSPNQDGLLMHLHGGIHFGSRSRFEDPNRFCHEANFHELYWHRDWRNALNSSKGSAPYSQAGRELTGGALVSGLHKTDKLLREPFSSYYHEFRSRVLSSRRLLVIGYGFNDFHINAVLELLNRVHGSQRRIAVIDKIAGSKEIGSTKRSNLIVQLGRWGEEHFDYHYRHKNPWIAKNGCVRFYREGLLEAAHGYWPEVADFLDS